MATKTKNKYANALTQVLPLAGRQEKMAYQVLKQLTGIALAKLDDNFDWAEYKENFDEQYEHMSHQKVMAVLAKLFGLTSLEEVREKYVKLSIQARKRTEQKRNKEEYEYEYEDNEFDLK